MRSTQHPTEPPPEGPSWSAGELISFGGLTDKGTGYMGYSERVGPSVLVLHDAYGLLPSVRTLTDRFVDDGFTTLAVDLYGGRYAEDAATAHRLAAGLDTADTMKRVVAAAEHLSNNWHPRLGVVGFSTGASLATMLAHEVAIDATVVYYGGGGAGLGQSWGERPLLGHFARGDDFEPATSALTAMSGMVDAEAFLYDAAHGFANSDLTSFEPVAAELALERTLEELHYQLS